MKFFCSPGGASARRSSPFDEAELRGAGAPPCALQSGYMIAHPMQPQITVAIA
jgi:hypothetical protein